MILTETQKNRDEELSQILNIPISTIKSKIIAAPNNIRIFAGDKTPKDYSILYKTYEYLDIVGYLRTLMYTSIHRRGEELFKLLQTTQNKICLDFGSGVGSHAIALMENKNFVSLLDVDGPLLQFAMKRIKHRNLEYLCESYLHIDILPINHYDLVICTDVLEHVVNPIYELKRITKSLKQNGLLYLCVSQMIKNSSGHFSSSIKKWQKDGPEYLRSRYVKISDHLYRKNNVYSSR